MSLRNCHLDEMNVFRLKTHEIEKDQIWRPLGLKKMAKPIVKAKIGMVLVVTLRDKC